MSSEKNKNIVLVFLHAFPLSSKMWDEQIKYFGGRCRVVAVDYPGFGGTSSDELPDEPTIYDYAGYVERAVKPAMLPSEKLCLVGLSMGGYISMAILRRQKLKVDGVVLANTRSEADTEDVRKRRYEIISQVENSGSIEPVLSAYLPVLAPEEGGFREKVKKLAEETSPDGAIKALKAMAGRDDFTYDVKNFVGKLLCIAGENDKLSPPDVMKKMVRTEDELKIIKGAGHLSAMEKPDEFNSTLLDFVEKLIPES